MLFNSYIFIFGFLPITLAIYWALHKAGKSAAALTFLVPASLVFYAWWKPVFVVLLLASMSFNFLAGKYISEKPDHKTVLYLAIGTNIALLIWFKYALFAVANINALSGVSLHLPEIFLPLGISFFTFHQISYLLDLAAKRIKPAPLRHYALYITFFPQLIAGPIVRAWEIIPQFDNFLGRERFWHNMAIGSGLFIVGLFKKVVIADTLSTFSSPIFAMAEGAHSLTFFDGWSGALAYTFQLYFDFSGYSDMALGLGLIFGFVLPLNFLSPYKATSMIDFWRRWHMTMSRFFRDYLYIPLGGNRVVAPRLAFNLLLTMAIAGLWHGAGWTFALWGVLHGIYLIINHGFVKFREKTLPSLNPENIFYRIFSYGLTMLAIVIGWVFFRAENFGAAGLILKAMSGANGIVLPERFFSDFSFFTQEGFLRLPAIGEHWIETSLWAFPWIAAAWAICLLMPASVQYFGLAEGKPRHGFSLDKRTALLIACLGIVSLLSMQRISEFLYFQF